MLAFINRLFGGINMKQSLLRNKEESKPANDF